jgi:hypothetical protein
MVSTRTDRSSISPTRNLAIQDDSNQYDKRGTRTANFSADMSKWSELSFEDPHTSKRPSDDIGDPTLGTVGTGSSKMMNSADHISSKTRESCKKDAKNAAPDARAEKISYEKVEAINIKMTPIGSSSSAHTSSSKKSKKKSLTHSLHSPTPRKDNEDRNMLMSPRSVISSIFTSKSGPKKSSIAKEDDTAKTLQAENDKLLKDCKRLKKQLTKMSAGLKKLEAMQQNISSGEEPATTEICQADAMREQQAELQMECYEKLNEAKDKRICNLERTNDNHEKRIAYLEFKCLQHGIDIDDDEKSFADDDEAIVWEEERKDDSLGRGLSKLDDPNEELFKTPEGLEEELVNLPISEPPKSSKHKQRDSWRSLEVGPPKIPSNSGRSVGRGSGRSSNRVEGGSNHSLKIPSKEGNQTVAGMGLKELASPRSGRISLDCKNHSQGGLGRGSLHGSTHSPRLGRGSNHSKRRGGKGSTGGGEGRLSVMSAIGKSLGESTEVDAEDLPLPLRKLLA